MKRCFAYIRVSTIRQGDGVSLDAQRAAIEAYAVRNQLQIERWFEEKETAARIGRPVFASLMRALHRREAQALVVHKIDRSARNFADWAKIGDLSDAGIDVHFASETLDFRSRGGRLAADIQAVVAADYIRNLRDETLKGLRGRLRQGIWPWPAPPGYCNNGGGQLKTIDPVLGPFVRKLFELYAGGEYSLTSLAAELYQQPLPAGAARLIKRSVLATILANPFYCGLLAVRTTGESFPGKHTPLVSVGLFRAVQNVKLGRTNKKVRRHNFQYSGLFQCGSCRAAMVAERQKGHIYYRCHTPGCVTNGVREEALDAAVARLLRSASLPFAHVERVRQRVLTFWSKDAAHNPAQALLLRYEHAKARLNRLTDAYLDEKLDAESFNARRQALSLEIVGLERETAEAERAPVDPDRVVQLLELFASLAQAYGMADPTARRQIVKLATSNRTVMAKNIDVTPSEWLTVGAVSAPRPIQLPASGHNSNAQNEYRERLAKLLNSEPVLELSRIVQEVKAGAAGAANDNARKRDARGRFVA